MRRTLPIFHTAGILPVLLACSTALADIPATINYQGQLRNNTDQLVNGNLSMTFCLYIVPSGGASAWCETHAGVSVDNGSFSVDLGSVTPFTNVNFDDRYYLGIQVGSDAEMIPRLAFASVPSAFKAADHGKLSRTVNCSGGEKITDALEDGAGIITIRGMCEENVMVWRDDVTLQPDTGTAGPHGVTGQAPTEDTEAAIHVVGGARIFIKGITVNGHTEGTGIFIDVAGSALIEGVTVQNAGESGLEICCNAVAIIKNSTFTGNNSGIEVTSGGAVEISATTVSNNTNWGISIKEGGTANIGDEDGGPGDVAITGNGYNGLEIRNGAASLGFLSITGNSGSGLSVYNGGSAELRDSTITGNAGIGLDLANGVVEMTDTTISGNTSFTAVHMSGVLYLNGGNAISHPDTGSTEETIFVSNGRLEQRGPPTVADTITSPKGSGDRAIGAYRFSSVTFFKANIDGGSGEAILLHNKSIGEIQGTENDIIGSVTCSSPHVELFDDNNEADSTPGCP